MLSDSVCSGSCCTCDMDSEVFLPSQTKVVVESKIASLQHRKTAGGKNQDERLREQAQLQLQLGQLVEYGETMIELNEWSAALAIAPAVSLSHWRKLSLQYAEHLEEQGLSDQAAVHWIAAGEVSKAVKSNMKKGLHRAAFVMATSQVQGRMPSCGSGAAAEDAVNASAAVDKGELEGVTEARVKSFNESALPILAACCLLAVDKPAQALQTLVTANETALALVLCQVLRLKISPQLYANMSRCCAALGAFAASLQFGNAAGSELAVDQLCMTVIKNDTANADSFLGSADRRTRAAFGSDAVGLEADGKHVEAARCYMFSGNPTAACKVALDALHVMMETSSWDIEVAKKLVWAVGIGSIVEVGDESRGQLLCYAALIGLFEAFWRDYRMVWHGLVLTVETKASLLPASTKEKVLAHVQQFRKILSKMSGLGNTLYTTGQLLPSAMHKPGAESAASGMMLTGAAIDLDNGTRISYSEGLMWAEVTPFSPSKSGEVLNPF